MRDTAVAHWEQSINGGAEAAGLAIVLFIGAVAHRVARRTWPR